MSFFTHVSMLEEKRGKLEQMINDESIRPLPDFAMIQTLKKQKLLLKEELQRLHMLQSNRQGAA